MAFRKLVKNVSATINNVGRFAEPQSVSVLDGSLDNVRIVQDVSVSELSDKVIPLVSLDSIVKSGEPLRGNVDFSPSDPTNGLAVSDTISDYLDLVSNDIEAYKASLLDNPDNNN